MASDDRLMPRARRFIQCDVFTDQPTQGNALAVVVDGVGLNADEMQRFATWANVAETTFLLPPETPGADYGLRIFTTTREIAFAGHPTLGSCMAWLAAGGTPLDPSMVRQECGIGLVEIDLRSGRPAFVAPPTKIVQMAEDMRRHIAEVLDLPPDCISRAVTLDNGSSWQLLELDSPARVLGANAQRLQQSPFRGIGLMARHGSGAGLDFEVRMLAPSNGVSEDPVTGSLNAAIGCWLAEEGRLTLPAIVAQGTAIGRTGRVHLQHDQDGRLTVGGDVRILIDGTVML
ncbi:PhzF family phenazine biosynthesis protein [Aquicoccus sp.]|uniref:PhzF family phenazine biosynthesis protein n=2 Tax=Aquicoccus sp. TaxID=2055851 RepID=UPI003562A495